MHKSILVLGILALTSAACRQEKTADAAKSNQAIIVTNSNAASAATTATNRNSTSEMNTNSMNHDSMKNSPDVANAPFDLQFLDVMIPHHQSAVDMAKMVLTQSQNTELKRFAEQIIADQTREIAQMKGWREQWFAGKPAAMNTEMNGTAGSMKMMSSDEMKKLKAATGKTFDFMFLEMMISHHDGAVAMAKDALQKAEHAEIKTLANQIITSQEAEIKRMNDWKTKWF